MFLFHKYIYVPIHQPKLKKAFKILKKFKQMGGNLFRNSIYL